MIPLAPCQLVLGIAAKRISLSLYPFQLIMSRGKRNLGAHRLWVEALLVIELRTASPSIMSPELYGSMRELPEHESFARAETESWTMLSTLYRCAWIKSAD